MRRRGTLVRLREEPGFTLIEALVAIGTIFVSLTALAYTGTLGFKYIANSREQQAANQIADKLMEDIRALPYAKVSQGLSVNLSAELATNPDPNIVSCSGALHLKTCDPGTMIVAAAPADAFPLVPHSGVIGGSDGYPTDYSWSTYVTNDDPTNDPYRVTVVVTWVMRGVPKIVQTQSLFAAAGGSATCGEGTHSFAGPCQPFFYGHAIAEQGRVDIETAGANAPIQGSTFVSGSLLTTGAESSLQQEQIAKVQGTLLQTGVSLTDATGAQTGAASVSTAADSDPSGEAPEYSRNPATGVYLGTAWDLLTGSTAPGSTEVHVANTAGDTGESVSAGAATAINVCPPSVIGMAESDAPPQACGGTWVRQAGPVGAYAVLDPLATGLGETLFARIDGMSQSQQITTFSDRDLVSPNEGNLLEAVSRSMGTVGIGGLPGNANALPSGWRGYLVLLEGYSDAVQATAGTAAPPPSATIGGGTISVWNGAGYETFDASDTAAQIPVPAPAVVVVGSHTVTVTLTPASGSLAAIAAVSGADPGVIARTRSQASVEPPLSDSFRYTITVDGLSVVDVTITVDLGPIAAESAYAPAPVFGPSPTPPP